MNKKNLIILCSTLLLNACTISNMREQLGFARHSPDEFSVIANPPLSVPKNFALPPVVSNTSEEKTGKKMPLAVDSKNAIHHLDKGDNYFLERAGIRKFDGEVRMALEEEEKAYHKENAKKKDSVFKQWFPSWINPEEDEDDDLLNPEEARQNLKKSLQK